jgi:hypothetical protein
LTVVVPTGNVEPESWSQLTGTLPSTLSVADGAAHVTTAPAEDVAFTVWLGGNVRTGAVLSCTSCTVIVKDPLAVFGGSL